MSDWALAKPRATDAHPGPELRGTMPEGSDFRAGSTWCRLYGDPCPEGMAAPDSAPLATAFTFGTRILELDRRRTTGAPVITIAEREAARCPPIRTCRSR